MIQELYTFLQNHPQLVLWVSVGSAVGFVGSLLAVPWLAVRIPEDYFLDSWQPAPTRFWFWALRNVCGAVLMLAGTAMLVLPGQGILTLLLGLVVCDFPWKRRLERVLVGFPGVLPVFNKLRTKRGVPPLKVDKSLKKPSKD